MGLMKTKEEWVQGSRSEPNQSLRSWMMDTSGGSTARSL